MSDWEDEPKPTKAAAKSGNDWDDAGDSSAPRSAGRVGRGGFSGGDRPPRKERTDTGDEYKETIKIEARKTGKIIGSGGSVIKELQEEHSVKINIPKEEDDDGMKEVEVIGQEADVQNAIRAIQEKTGGSGGRDRPPREDNGDEYREFIKIEARKTGKIIGSGGSVIKELQEEHSVKINIPREEDDDGTKEVEVIGQEADVKNAITAIQEKVGGSGGRDRPPREQTYDSYGGDDDKFSETFEIDVGKVGRLVGPKGAVINELQSEYSIKIDISKEDNGNDKREVKVSGDESDVKKAVKAIQEKIGGGGGDGKPTENYVPPEPTNDETEMFSNGIQAGINFDKFDKIDVSLSGDGAEAIKQVHTFAAIGLRELLVENVERSGYKRPTPIQKYAIPAIMAQRDLMGCAQTGSGKTAAFILPILDRIMKAGESVSVGQPQALIIAPTRELVIQIFDEARKFANRSWVKVCIAYGGTASRHQSENISKGCHVLVATPGRLMDYVGKALITFDSLQFLVLDEADRMLDMGFRDSIVQITDHPTIQKDKVQTLMFSATFPEEIQRLAAAYLRNYIFLTVGIVGGASTDVDQEILEVTKFKKRSKLSEILEEYCQNSDEDRILVFVETKRTADFLASLLSETKISSTSIHGDRLQSERETALREFRNGKRKVLIATSVAARGLDIKGVTHVINYDLPKEVQDYVHRIGRTGRVGNRGKATSFYDPENDSGIAEDLARILSEAGQPIPEFLGYSGGGDCGDGDNFGGTDIRKGVASAKKQEADDENW